MKQTRDVIRKRHHALAAMHSDPILAFPLFKSSERRLPPVRRLSVSFIKLTILLLLCAIQIACGANAARFSSSYNHKDMRRPRLSRDAAIQLAAKIPRPKHYTGHGYRFSGTALYYSPLKQWAVAYELKTFSGISGDDFAIWIDDATGGFVRYGYGR